MKPIPYGRHSITQEDIDAVSKVMTADFLTQGPVGAEFEKAFAEYIGCKYAVAVSNGTAALHLSVLALNVKPGTRVITSPITFAASANCVLYAGGEIVFSDIDPQTYTLDIQKVRKLLESHPKGYFSGIIPVDLAGYPVNSEAFKNLADEFGLWILEDACHAPGGWIMDSKNEKQFCGNGKYCDAAIFSFHPVKHIATGEGGMITTNRKDLYDRLANLRSHGITKDPNLMHENHGGWYYEMQELGFNYRLTEMQSALGTSQLKRANEGLKRRHEIADRYYEAFKNVPGITTPYQSNQKDIYHAFHLFVILVQDRLGLYDFLKQNHIFVQVHYIPVHLLPYYKNLGWKKGDFPIAENYYEHCLSLPLFPTLTNEEQEFVINKVKEFVK